MPEAPRSDSGTVGPGLRLAVTTFTVLPVREPADRRPRRTGTQPPAADRATEAPRITPSMAAVAVSAAPVVGALIGGVVAAVAIGGRAAHAPALLVGFVG